MKKQLPGTQALSSLENSAMDNPVKRAINNALIHGVAHQTEKDTDYFFEKKALFGFVGDASEPTPRGISFSLLDYIELVDWSGRIIRDDKCGAIEGSHPKLLSALDLDIDTWLSLALFAEHTGKRWISSKNQLRRCLH